MRELHLFAGIGGGILAGMLLGHRCVGAVEIDEHCRKVLAARQADGILEPFPIFEDVRGFDGRAWRGKVDVICGGFPCQPFSPAAAGRKRGRSDPRYLWPEMARVVGECEPAIVFAENVALSAFTDAVGDLEGMGFRVAPALRLGADQVGAPYQRKRWWLLAAHPDRDWQPVLPQHAEVAGAPQAGDADGSRLAQREGFSSDACEEQPAAGAAWWAYSSRLRRLVSGDAPRVDPVPRITAAGNAQVPQVAAAAFRILTNHILETEAHPY